MWQVRDSNGVAPVCEATVRRLVSEKFRSVHCVIHSLKLKPYQWVKLGEYEFRYVPHVSHLHSEACRHA